MASETLGLSETTVRGVAALGRAIGRSRAKPVRVRLTKGERPVADGEVLVMVFSGDEGVASRTTIRGREVDLKELLLHLAGVEAAVATVDSERQSASMPQLTEGEASMLDLAGLREEDTGAASALDRSRIELELLMHSGSLSLDEAAKALGVGTSRLRQRLSASVRSIYGVKDGRAWRIPRFQIGDDERSVTPLAWLAAGHSPDAVAKLAEEI